MSRAFNMVDHGQPFEALRQRNLPNPVIQFLPQWYSNHHLEIR